MGARIVKQVNRSWSPSLRGRPLQLLLFAANTVPDRTDRPRVELSREAMAAALGFLELTATAKRAVARAVAKLVATGAWTVARKRSPVGRGHYWLHMERPSMDEVTVSSPVEITPVDGLGDRTVTSESSYSSFCTQEQEITDTPTSCPSLRLIEGTGNVAKNKGVIPGQRSLLIHAVSDPDAPVPSAPPARRGHPVVAAWVDYCTTQGVKLPRQIIGQYARGIATALADGFEPDMVKRVLAQMLTDGVAHRPSLLANRLVAAQTGPEVRTVVKSKLVDVNGRMMNGRDLDNLRLLRQLAEEDAADARKALEA